MHSEVDKLTSNVKLKYFNYYVLLILFKNSFINNNSTYKCSNTTAKSKNVTQPAIYLKPYDLNTHHKTSKNVSMRYSAAFWAARSGSNFSGGEFSGSQSRCPFQNKCVHGAFKQRLNETQTQDLVICNDSKLNICIRRSTILPNFSPVMQTVYEIYITKVLHFLA